MANVELNVRSELGKIIEELKKVQEQAEKVGQSFSSGTEDAGKAVLAQTKKTETFFGKLGNVARRTLDEIKRDFSALASLKSLTAGLTLSNQFGDSISQTISLSDTIRKLGTSFGIARKDFSTFQNSISKGMGDIGMSSEDAAEALKGLAGSGVKGEGAIEYAKSASQLASLGGEKGQTGNVAAGIAGVVRAQGKDVNDPKAMQAVARAVTKGMEGTGQSATQVLHSMQEMFQSMPAEMRKTVTPEALTSYSAAESVAGPGATSGLKHFMSMDEIQKQQLKAMGLGKVFGKSGGLDIEGLKSFAKEAKSLGLDMRTSFKHAGFSDEEAEGMVRLAEGADRVAEAMQRTAQASDDYTTKTRKNMTMQESFSANINKLKGLFGGGGITQGISDALGSASESTGGAAAVVGGSAVLAALLAGGGLKGIGKGLGIGGMMKKEATEAITGEKVQNVYVVNASEIGGGGLGDTAKKAAGLVGGSGMAVGGAAVAMLAAGAAAAYVAKTKADEVIESPKTKQDLLGFAETLQQMKKGTLPQQNLGPVLGPQGQGQSVNVNLKLAPGIQKTRNSQGASYGPHGR